MFTRLTKLISAACPKASPFIKTYGNCYKKITAVIYNFS